MPVPTLTADSAGQSVMEAAVDRRADVDAKHRQIANLIEQIGCQGLLVLDQVNLTWLTGGAVARSILDPEEMPALYYTPTQRWLLASNGESQRMFDEEINQLGFMLKEWPWYWGRGELLTHLCEGKSVAADQPYQDARVVGDQLRVLRRSLTPYEQACLRQLGQQLGHAVEATCRGANPGDTERELAGQLAHRLVRRGAVPLAISVAADGRSRAYRRSGFTMNPVRSYCVVSATVRKYGLHATASRSFSFGPPDETFRKEHLTACKVAATYVASTWPDAGPREILNSGKRVYLLTGFEYEWQLCPQGYITGHAPVELNFFPESTALIQVDWALTWTPTVGAASSCDTFLVLDSGPQLVTPAEDWPLLNIRILGSEFPRPHILER